MSIIFTIILFSLVGGIFSLIGAAVLLSAKRIKEKTLIHLVIFSAGALLGAALLNIIPEALHHLEDRGVEGIEPVTQMMLLGILVFFTLERLLLRFHGHQEHEGHAETTHLQTSPHLLILGDSLHNLLDGVAITASFLISVPVGIVTAIAVAAHEIPTEIGEFSVMLQAGWNRMRVLLTNAASSLMTVVGALLTYLFRENLEGSVGYLLAFTAGIFIYISLSDLIPEIHHKTRKDSAWHVLSLLLTGIVIVRVVSLIAESYAPI